MRCREQARIIGYDSQQGTVAAQLIESPVDEFHEYVRIFFESGVEGPVRVLWLWRWVVNLPHGLLQFLPGIGKVSIYDEEYGSEWS